MAGPSLTAQIWIDLRTFDSSRWQAPAMGQRELGRFAGAAVIITGGAHGIGRACAARLAEEGATSSWPTLIKPQPSRWLRVSLPRTAAMFLSGWM